MRADGTQKRSTRMTDEAALASPRAHWKRRSRTVAIPPGHAARQGAITQLAYLLLGREAAIAFLNTNHVGLGGRPLDLAMTSDVGRNKVEAELGRMVYAAPRAAS